ncbi:phospholipid/glycerol acyltransferase [Kangiella koreensis DSM 16069]|uniref:Phospholipid/glycerol acyltransferase n=2 Tax=Kangiella TaxID=261963 RepID=C7RC99_KANKD|nr:phospholipid/glycerol acyltransferase [Kangiella koreensis DSM 16069]
MRYIMKALLRLLGWRLVGQLPKDKKYVVIFAPHTSNWDFVLMLMVRFCFKMKIGYLGKHTLFKPPFGWFFRMFGGIPVERSSANNVVDQVAAIIKEREEIQFALAPEGTRSYKPYWKSGFYHIALKAEVPILMTFLNSKTKEIGIGDLLRPSGNQEQDLDVIRAFYKDKAGIRPELTSDIRFEEKR